MSDIGPYELVKSGRWLYVIYYWPKEGREEDTDQIFEEPILYTEKAYCFLSEAVDGLNREAAIKRRMVAG